MRRLLLIAAAALALAGPALAQQVLNLGASTNDGTGDPLRTAGQKINANFSLSFVTLQPALTGPITTLGNSNVTNVTPGSLTNSMLAPMSASSMKCNTAAGLAAPADCTVAQMLTLLASTSGGSASNCLSGAATWVACSGGGGGGFPSLTMPGVFTVTGSGTSSIGVAAAGTSGGVPYFATSTTMASSGVLTTDQIVLGGGPGGSPFALGSLGNTISVLHGNVAGVPSWSVLNLSSEVQGTLGSAFGGTGVNNGARTLTINGNFAVFNSPASGNVGTLELVQNAQGTSYTAVLSDNGKQLYHNSLTAHTFTIPSNASVAFPIGAMLTFINGHLNGTLTIAINSDTLYFSPSGGIGTRTLAALGVATAVKVEPTVWIMGGTGIL